MSKKKNISYLFGLAFLLLAGCDTDTATVPLPDDGERAVEVRLRASCDRFDQVAGMGAFLHSTVCCRYHQADFSVRF